MSGITSWLDRQVMDRHFNPYAREVRNRTVTDWVKGRRSEMGMQGRLMTVFSLLALLVVVLIAVGRAADAGEFMLLAMLVAVGLVVSKRYRWAAVAFVLMSALGIVGVTINGSHVAVTGWIIVPVLAAVIWCWCDLPTRILVPAVIAATWAVLVGIGLSDVIGGWFGLAVYAFGAIISAISLFVLMRWVRGRDLLFAGLAVSTVLFNWLVFGEAGQGVLFDDLQQGGSGTFDSGWVFHFDWLCNAAVLGLLGLVTWQSTEVLEEITERSESYELMDELYAYDRRPKEDGEPPLMLADQSDFRVAALEVLEMTRDELAECGVDTDTYLEYRLGRFVMEVRQIGAELVRRNGVIKKSKLPDHGYRLDFADEVGATPEEIKTGRLRP